MIRFAKDVKNWLDYHSDNVIAVHCKGGKGSFLQRKTKSDLFILTFNI